MGHSIVTAIGESWCRMKMDDKYKEFCRFCVVGVICTAIDVGIFYLIRNVASYQVSLICGYCLSLIVNYLLTIYWTFRSVPSVKNAIAVVTAHLINLFVVRMGLMWAFVNIIGLNDRLAYVLTLMISVVLNFLMVKLAVNKIK